MEAGGAERALVNLLMQSRGGDIDHSVLCLRGPGFFAEQVRAAGVPLDCLNMRLPTAPLDLLRLRRAVRARRPDIVQGWMYYANLAALASLWGTGGARPRLVWGIRCSDMNFSDYSPLLRTSVRAGAWLSRAPDMIVANSHAGYDVHRTLGYRPERFEVVENGFDLAHFTPDNSAGDNSAGRALRRELGLSDADFVCTTVARVDPMKGYETLAAVAARLPDVHFLAVGRGTEALKGPSNLHGLGRRGDIPDILNASDLLISTSRYGEGMSNSIGEAMACATPVIATDCGDAHRMLIADWDGMAPAGVVTTVGDVEAIAGAVEALRGDPDRRRALAAGGRARAEARYGIATNAAAWGALYRRLSPG
nr:glycosyltransferase [Marivibrio halodurans]